MKITLKLLPLALGFSMAPLCAMQKKSPNKQTAQQFKREVERKGYDVNAHLPADGLTPLLFAVEKNKPEPVRVLIELGADVNISALETNISPLHIAASKGNLEIMKLLLDAGAFVDEVDCKNLTPLHYAALEGKTQAAMMLLVEGADSEIADGTGFTPLHIAAQKGNGPLVNSLIRYQADVHACTKAKNTPLMLTYDPFVAQLLLEEGSDLEARDIKGNTVLLRACFLGKEELAEFYVACGANINVHGYQSKAPLHVSIQNGYSRITQMLLGHGAFVDVCDVHESTPLMYAVHFNNAENIADLLAHGADQNCQNKDGETVFDIAIKKGHPQLVDMFEMPFDLIMPV